ncbi:DUF4389 domain-containing protein [Citricoccus sp. SGAir0253]|nr:DUF4389 domain-containing protein [Citricoccus sp. SGAir0253]
MAGLGLTVAGAAVLRAGAEQRDGGFVVGDVRRLQSTGYALATAPVVLGGPDGADGAPGPAAGDLLTVQVRAASVVPGRDVFVGIAPADRAAAYLDGVRHTVLGPGAWGRGPWDPSGWGVSGWTPGGGGAGAWGPRDWPGWAPGTGWGAGTGPDGAPRWGDRDADRPDRADSGRTVDGDRRPAEPAAQDFWVASATGPGEQALEWVPGPGRWTLVVMDADAGQPVWVDVRAGARSGLLGPVGTGLLWAGIAGLVVGVPLLLLGAAGLGRDIDPAARAEAAGRRRGPGAAAAAEPAPVRAVPGAYPLRIGGILDEPLSRGLWLVKWLLAIPHYLVLALLWFALVVTTVAAGLAVLVTGRYPRAWFAFAVGVLRWSWRVGFYGYSALGTDRYPPFSLAPAPYPAALDVAYPERLSRGLVLVKWWLLALPHLVVVGILTGGTGARWADGPGDRAAWGPSLVGLLVLIAAVVLLFTGRYRTGLFDLVVGLDRWSFRVAAYVLLLRDEYPPFRLDQGPVDPGWAPGPVTTPPGPPPAAGTDPRAEEGP